MSVCITIEFWGGKAKVYQLFSVQKWTIYTNLSNCSTGEIFPKLTFFYLQFRWGQKYINQPELVGYTLSPQVPINLISIKQQNTKCQLLHDVLRPNKTDVYPQGASVHPNQQRIMGTQRYSHSAPVRRRWRSENKQRHISWCSASPDR